jgi:hypothetical protein
LSNGGRIGCYLQHFVLFGFQIKSRMVSKPWYENDRGRWINLMRKRFEDIQKNHETLRLASHMTGENLMKKSLKKMGRLSI